MLFRSIIPSTLTPSAQPSPTKTVDPSATPKPTLTNISTKTIVPTPTDQPDCTNLAEFIDDISIPDNTLLDQGESFTKTWRIRNAGTCTWNERYFLVFLKGDQLSAPGSTGLQETLPGKNIDVSVDMIVPMSDGSFMGVYQFQAPNGKRFSLKDGNLWIKITVGSGTPPISQTPIPKYSSTPDLTNIQPTIEIIDTPTYEPTKTSHSGKCLYTQDPNFEAQIVSLINVTRYENGLPPFKFNELLSSAALKHSIDMGCNNFLKHSGSDNSTAKSRVKSEGYSASSIQEGIYAQPLQYGGTPESAVDWWLNDAIHRAILLNTKLTEIGVGYVNVPTSSLGGYFTIDVATP